MKFEIGKNTYNRGTKKAFSVTDSYNRTYYIPRTQTEVLDEYVQDGFHEVLLIEVKDWVIHRNNIPVFNLTEMGLIRGMDDWEWHKGRQ